MACKRISLSYLGGILLDLFDPGKIGRLLFSSVSCAVNILKGMYRCLRIAQRIARFFLGRALMGRNTRVNPPGCASSGHLLCHCFDSLFLTLS